jgi:hypothetical protein
MIVELTGVARVAAAMVVGRRAADDYILTKHPLPRLI